MEQSNESAAQGTSGLSVAQKLEESRRDVLDLSLRNSLLNFRPSGRLGVEVVDELSSEIYRILVHERRIMYFLPAPEQKSKSEAEYKNDEFPFELLTLLAEPEIDSDEPADRHLDNKLQTSQQKPTLTRRLTQTYRHARLSIQEQGVNTLYLALGLLRWYESDSSEQERAAPLILIPVRLDRSDVRHSFKLSWTEDEIEVNLSLEAKLKNDFGVRLPGLPKKDDLEVTAYLQQVSRAVNRQERWYVDENAIHLGFFSFSKFLIYKDLDPELWPEGEKPADHPVVHKLYHSAGFRGDASTIAADEHIDDHPSATGLHQVVDADSSQTLAVIDAIDGRNLVIQGPPGTGKSQTITNLLAEALARGKKILFVAEKMAALEVVKRRLDTIHLGDACLELHSHNTNKRAVLDELKRTLDLGKPAAWARVDDEVLKMRRRQLNEYADAVNEPIGTSGFTPHQLVGKLEELRTGGLSVDGLGIRCRDSVSWSAPVFARHRALAEDIQSLVRGIGCPRDHLFWGVGLLHVPLPADEHRIRQALESASSELRHLRGQLTRLRALLLDSEGTGDESPRDAQRSLHTADKVAEASELIAADHRNPAWVARAPDLNELRKDALQFADLHARYDSVLIPEAWEADVLDIRQALAAYGGKWWRLVSRTWRTAMARLRGLCRTDPPKDAPDCLKMVDGILEARRLRQRIAESRELVASLFPGQNLADRPEPYREFARATEWFVALHEEKAAGNVDDAIHEMLDRRPGSADVQEQTQACSDALERLGQALESVAEAFELRADRFPSDNGPWERPYGDLDRWLASAAAQLPSASEVVRFNQLEQKAIDAKIPEVAEAAASRADAGEKLVALFEHGCYSTWLEAALRERPALAQFDGDTQKGIAEQFRGLDMSQFESNRVHIAQRHWEGLPRHHGGGQLGVLRREFEKKSRHLPVRDLVTSVCQKTPVPGDESVYINSISGAVHVMGSAVYAASGSREGRHRRLKLAVGEDSRRERTPARPVARPRRCPGGGAPLRRRGVGA